MAPASRSILSPPFSPSCPPLLWNLPLFSPFRCCSRLATPHPPICIIISSICLNAIYFPIYRYPMVLTHHHQPGSLSIFGGHTSGPCPLLVLLCLHLLDPTHFPLVLLLFHQQPSTIVAEIANLRQDKLEKTRRHCRAPFGRFEADAPSRSRSKAMAASSRSHTIPRIVHLAAITAATAASAQLGAVAAIVDWLHSTHFYGV